MYIHIIIVIILIIITIMITITNKLTNTSYHYHQYFAVSASWLPPHLGIRQTGGDPHRYGK